jgi:hypothetical protein
VCFYHSAIDSDLTCPTPADLRWLSPAPPFCSCLLELVSCALLLNESKRGLCRKLHFVRSAHPVPTRTSPSQWQLPSSGSLWSCALSTSLIPVVFFTSQDAPLNAMYTALLDLEVSPECACSCSDLFAVVVACCDLFGCLRIEFDGVSCTCHAACCTVVQFKPPVCPMHRSTATRRNARLPSGSRCEPALFGTVLPCVPWLALCLPHLWADRTVSHGWLVCTPSPHRGRVSPRSPVLPSHSFIQPFRPSVLPFFLLSFWQEWRGALSPLSANQQAHCLASESEPVV